MPLLPPVMTATFPFSFFMTVLLLLDLDGAEVHDDTPHDEGLWAAEREANDPHDRYGFLAFLDADSAGCDSGSGVENAVSSGADVGEDRAKCPVPALSFELAPP